jgi:hypothetical protein
VIARRILIRLKANNRKALVMALGNLMFWMAVIAVLALLKR